MPFLVAALAAIVCLTACGSGSGTRPPQPDTGYVEWIAGRAWTIDELPAVAAAFEQICSRASEGDGAAALDAASMASDLWVVSERLLSLLRSIPDEADTTTLPAFPSGCPPDPALAESSAALIGGDAAPIAALESGPGGSGLADDARFLRVLEALGIVADAGGPSQGEPLARAVAILEANGAVVAGDAAEVWETLAVEAMDATDGGDAVDFESLGAAARDRLAREGFLLRIRRVVLPVSEDAGSRLREIAVETFNRFVREWTGGDEAPDPAASMECGE